MRTLLARLATLAATVAALVACDHVEKFSIGGGEEGAAYAEAGAQAKAIQVVGIGPVKKEARKTAAFGRVQVSGAFQVEVRRGNPSVTVEAQHSLLKHIKTEVRNGELIVMTEASMSADKPMKVWVTTNNLNGLSVSGACRVACDSYTAKDFELEIEGASQVKLPLTAKSLNADLGGASEVTITGSAPRLNLELDGAARFSGSGFRVERAHVDLNGASQADLRVDREITGDATGASSIRYRGNPKTSVETNDVSSISRA
jgi:hypothetical protein